MVGLLEDHTGTVWGHTLDVQAALHWEHPTAGQHSTAQVLAQHSTSTSTAHREAFATLHHCCARHCAATYDITGQGQYAFTNTATLLHLRNMLEQAACSTIINLQASICFSNPSPHTYLQPPTIFKQGSFNKGNTGLQSSCVWSAMIAPSACGLHLSVSCLSSDSTSAGTGSDRQPSALPSAILVMSAASCCCSCCRVASL